MRILVHGTVQYSTVIASNVRKMAVAVVVSGVALPAKKEKEEEEVRLMKNREKCHQKMGN